MAPISETHPLRVWLAGLVRDAFHVQVGLCEPAVVDYVTDLLTEFIHSERINRLQDGSGRPVDSAFDALAAVHLLGQSVDPRDAVRRAAIHRQVGDFMLFWTGVYPEQLRRMRRRQAKDALLSCFEQGKRSYALASDLSPDDTVPPASLFALLSREFEPCAHGLHLVRRGWEQSEPAAFAAVNRPWLGQG